ncbi:MAG: hypothetical protein N3A02_04980, partial [Rectinema sp.]|nr:hypothetical protein [Rectinema sp.]
MRMVELLDTEGKTPFRFKRLQPLERMAFIAGTLFFSLLGVAVLYLQINSMFRARLDQLELIARYETVQLESWYQDNITEAAELSNSRDIASIALNAIRREDSDSLRMIDITLEPIRRIRNYADAVLLDQNLKVIYSRSSTRSQYETIDRDFLSKAIAARDNHKAFMTDLTLIPPYGKPGVYFVAPLVMPSSPEPFAYVVYVSYAKDYLYPLIQSWPGSEKSGEIILLRSEGTMARLLNPPRNEALSPFFTMISADQPRSAEALAIAGKREAFVARDYRGKLVFATTKNLAIHDWILMAKIDHEEVVQGWLPLFAIFLLYIVLLFVASLAAGHQLLSSRAIAAYQNRLALLRRAEQSEALLNTILNRMPSLILVVGDNGSIVFSNSIYKAHFGHRIPESLQEMLRRNHEHDPETAQATQWQHLTRRVELEDIEGKQLVMVCIPFPLTLTDQPRLTGLILRDMTEMEESLAT